MNEPIDRRQHSRYPANHLDVLIQTNSTVDLPWALAELVAVDFNQYGIAIQSDHYFGVGDNLSLIICTDDSVTAKVKGIVCNRTVLATGYRYGLYFDYSETKQAIPERQVLIDIEESVK